MNPFEYFRELTISQRNARFPMRDRRREHFTVPENANNQMRRSYYAPAQRITYIIFCSSWISCYFKCKSFISVCLYESAQKQVSHQTRHIFFYATNKLVLKGTNKLLLYERARFARVEEHQLQYELLLNGPDPKEKYMEIVKNDTRGKMKKEN